MQARNIRWPAGTVLVHPWNHEPVLIGWRSPEAGNVFVTGSVALAEFPNCGSGIDWSLARGRTVLDKGEIQQHETDHWSVRVHVKKGQMLYLGVSPRIGYACDSTVVHLAVTRGRP